MLLIYGAAIMWCVRSSRALNPSRQSKRRAKVIRMKFEALSLELDEKLGLTFKEMKS